MDFLFFYRDPLFGVILFITIIAVIALIDYFRNRYRAQKKEKSLKDLAKSYEYTMLNEDITKFIQISPNSLQPLILMAKSYAQSGDNERAIQIYLSALESIQSHKDRILALEGLGEVYLQAGFLQRSRDIYTQILRTYPRNPSVLNSLMQTYEKMGEYKNALEVLGCLDEVQNTQFKDQNVNQKEVDDFNDFVKKSQSYFYFMILLQTEPIPLALKVKNLRDIGKTHPMFNRAILKFFRTNHKKAFWKFIKSLESVRNYIDILYPFNAEELPDDLKQYPQIYEIFIAKGIVLDECVCEVFELEILSRLRDVKNAYLGFEYRCDACKGIFPFDSLRCPQCGELGEMDLIIKVLERRV